MLKRKYNTNKSNVDITKNEQMLTVKRRKHIDIVQNTKEPIIQNINEVRYPNKLTEPKIEPTLTDKQPLIINHIKAIDRKKIIFVTSECILSLVKNMENIFKYLGYDTDIIFELTKNHCTKSTNDELYIIVNDNRKGHSFYPKLYIVYQVEQGSSQYFTNRYIDLLSNSFACWEFSMKNSKKYEKHIQSTKIYNLIFPFFKENIVNERLEQKYDIFFYGADNDRRRKILREITDRLGNKYTILCKFGVYNNERDNLIKQSKIILNLHYYDDCALEIARINEVLKYEKLVISERPAFDDSYNQTVYGQFIEYCDVIDENLENIDKMCDLIEYYMNPNTYDKKIKKIRSILYKLQKMSIFHIQKNLVSLGYGKNEMIFDMSFGKIYCLHLLETPYRLQSFQNQKYIPKFEIYPAVKMNPAWKGCASSYQNLIWNAKRCKLTNVTICEDDCCFPPDFSEKYQTIKLFLSEYKEWDIFVGCIADLSMSVVIKNIVKYKNMLFVEIDTMTSTVFNIYNYTCYDAICEWDVNNSNVHTNTIDRYIGSKKMRIITTYPFEFSCLNVQSTIWGKNLFMEYNNMFAKSSELLKKKIDEFEIKKNKSFNDFHEHKNKKKILL